MEVTFRAKSYGTLVLSPLNASFLLYLFLTIDGKVTQGCGAVKLDINVVRV